MKSLFLLLLAVSIAVGQKVAVEPDSQTVVATVNGRKLTAAELTTFVGSLPAQFQQFWERDRKGFLEQYALLDVLAKVAEEEKIPEREPYKSRLEYARRQTLQTSLFEAHQQAIPVELSEIQAAFQASQDKYTQAKVKMLYISFVSGPAAAPADPKAPKPLTEAEAKTKIEGLLKQIRSGGDFVKLLKEHSEDPASKEKDGDFGTIRKSDRLPEDVKKAIFSMKPGQVSDPIRQPNGFYLFRLEELTQQKFDEVKEAIASELKQKKFDEWFQGIRKRISIQYDNEGFFQTSAPAPKPGNP
jgi:peptidyl-prolyl cis-trans isomerase C